MQWWEASSRNLAPLKLDKATHSISDSNSVHLTECDTP